MHYELFHSEPTPTSASLTFGGIALFFKSSSDIVSNDPIVAVFLLMFYLRITSIAFLFVVVLRPSNI